MDWLEAHETLVGVTMTIVVTFVLPLLFYVYGRVRASIVDEAKVMLDAHIREAAERRRSSDVGFAELRAAHESMSCDMDSLKRTLGRLDDKTDMHGEKLASIDATLVLIKDGLNGFMKFK